MAIYRVRSFCEETTPEYPGVDLDAVEKAIMDKTGTHDCCCIDKSCCESPVDECAAIMYESEYNFNQIMKCIGINELGEFAKGNDFILEGANLEAFFTKARDFFVRMFEGFVSMCQKIFNQLKAALSADKKLIENNGKEIEAGFHMKGWSFEDAWDFDKLNIKYQPNKNSIANVDLGSLIDDAHNNTVLDDSTFTNIAAVKRVSGVDVTDEAKAAVQMKEILNKRLFVTTKYTSSNGGLLHTVIEILKNGNDINELTKAYEEVKSEYKKIISNLRFDNLTSGILKSANRTLGDKEGKEEMAKVQSLLSKYMALAKYEKNLQHSYFVICLSAHRARRNQARKMALKWYKLANGEMAPAPAAKPAALPAGAKHENSMFKFDFAY